MRIILLFISVILIGCGSEFEGYDTLSSGLHFKLLSISDSTKRIQNNNYIQLKYSFSDYAKTELASSRLLIKVNDVNKKGGLVEALTLINEKEEGAFVFPLEKLKSDLDGIFNIEGLPDTTLLFANLQIDNIFEKSEFEKAQHDFVQWVNEVDTREFDVLKEELLIDRFEDSLNLTTQKTATGLRYSFLKKGEGEESSFGKRVELEYVGSFLNGEIFNTTENLENGTQDFYVGQEMQVIKGIEEALLFLREGDEILLMLPSWTAFGQAGSSTGIVPPKTPIVYKLTLKSVN